MWSTETSCNMRGKGKTKKRLTSAGLLGVALNPFNVNQHKQTPAFHQPQVATRDSICLIPKFWPVLVDSPQWPHNMGGVTQMPFLPWEAVNIQLASIWDIQCCKRLRMWLCLMIKERTTQTRWTWFRKVDLEQFRNKNDGQELLTITFKLAWRSLGLCTCCTFEFTSCSVTPHTRRTFSERMFERREGHNFNNPD